MNMDLFKFKAFFDGAVIEVAKVDFKAGQVFDENGAWCGFDDCHIMQYTGCTDAEGEEIYTGMIVQNYLGDSYIVHQAEEGGQFVLEETCYGHETPINEHCLFEFKIVGTIFESVE
jgi:hypothetical protein